MHPILEAIFSWEVFGVGFGPLVAYLLVSDQFRHFRTTQICSVIAAAWLWGKVIVWVLFSSNGIAIRGVLALFGACLAVAGGWAVARLVKNREAARSSVHKQLGGHSVSAYETFDWTMRELIAARLCGGKATGKTKQAQKEER